jgi:hypothetical protein
MQAVQVEKCLWEVRADDAGSDQKTPAARWICSPVAGCGKDSVVQPSPL